MPIFRRTNCILTASGNVALCKWLNSTPVESSQPVYCAHPASLYGRENWVIKTRDARRITAAEMKYMRKQQDIVG
jgi:hypothetical protein